MARYTAFAIHLALSLLVVGALLGISILLWFPSPLFEIDGGWSGLRIVALVDLVLGPLLTLVVFRAGKPGLKMDMGIIVTIQVAALSYGVWTLHHNRPVLLVYADDLIKPIPASVVQDIDPQRRLPERFGNEFPIKLAIPIPLDPEQGSPYLLKRIFSETPLHLHTEDYVRLSEWWPEVIADSLNIEKYAARKPEWQRALEHSLAELKRPIDELVFLPIMGRKKSGIVIAEATSGDFVGFIDIPFFPEWGSRRVPLKERLATAMPPTGPTQPAPQTFN
jgi:hypothetical protein